MRPFATYAVRFHIDKFDAILPHWEHHRPLCINGVISIDEGLEMDPRILALSDHGLKVVTAPTSGDIDGKCRQVLVEEASKMDGEWFLTLDSDEYIPPDELPHIYRASLECEPLGCSWIHGWVRDRVSIGGVIGPAPVDYRYSALNSEYPVRADITKSIQGSCNVKCILAKKPDFGQIHTRGGNPHPDWIPIDHFKWFGDCIEISRGKINTRWFHQYNNLIKHVEKNGRLLAEHCLCDSWNLIDGWFDYWDVYSQAAEKFKEKEGSVFVEVGVWQGKSAIFLIQYALAVGAKFHLWLVDVFRGTEFYQGALNGILGHRGKGSSFISLPIKNIDHLAGIDQCSFLQIDSAVASRIFDDKVCDFVFIDGDHSFDGVTRDILAWLPKMARGGVLAGHDYNHHSVYRAVNEIFDSRDIEHVGNCWRVNIP